MKKRCPHDDGNLLKIRREDASHKDPGECAYCVIAERDALRAELADRDRRIEALTDCLDGSSKAKYTAEMYDAVRAELTAALKRVEELEEANRWRRWRPVTPQTV